MKKFTLLLLMLLAVVGVKADDITLHTFDLSSGWSTDGSVVSYSSNTITSTAGYSGYLQNWCEGSGYKATQFILTTESAAGLKVSVYYSGGSSSDVDASGVTTFEIDLDPTQVIQKIMIQTKEAETTGIVLASAVLKTVATEIDLSKFDAGTGVTWNTSTLTATFPDDWGNNYIQDWSNLKGKYAEQIVVNNTAAANYQVDGQYTDESTITASRIYDKTSCTVTLDPTKAIKYVKITCTKDNGETVTFTNAYMVPAYLGGATTSITNGSKAPVYFYKKLKAGWNTFCTPFEMTIASDIAADAEAYTFTSYDSSTKKVTFTKVDGTTLSAGVPYLLKLSEATTIAKLFEDKTLSSAFSNPTASNGMSFKGNYTAGMDMEGKYGVASGVIRPGASGSKLNSFAAYFEISSGEAHELLSIEIDDKGTTGVNEVAGLVAGVRNDYYNMNGQRVQNPTKGLYIVNGKKVINK